MLLMQNSARQLRQSTVGRQALGFGAAGFRKAGFGLRA